MNFLEKRGILQRIRSTSAGRKSLTPSERGGGKHFSRRVGLPPFTKGGLREGKGGSGSRERFRRRGRFRKKMTPKVNGNFIRKQRRRGSINCRRNLRRSTKERKRFTTGARGLFKNPREGGAEHAQSKKNPLLGGVLFGGGEKEGSGSAKNTLRVAPNRVLPEKTEEPRTTTKPCGCHPRA